MPLLLQLQSSSRLRVAPPRPAQLATRRPPAALDGCAWAMSGGTLQTRPGGPARAQWNAQRNGSCAKAIGYCLTGNYALPIPIQAMEQQTEAAWCAKALFYCQRRDVPQGVDPSLLCAALLQVLQGMKDAGLSASEQRDHPAAGLMAAQLAEYMGLQFFWPTRQEEQARALVARPAGEPAPTAAA